MSPDILDSLARAWNGLVAKNRDLLLFGSLVISGCVAFLPFARETSYSNFFIYALLPIILVYANPGRFQEVPGPAGLDLVFAIAAISGSFLFNWFFGIATGNMTFGITDFVVLVVGVFSLFYSVRHMLVRFGVFVLLGLRAGTLALSAAYPLILDAVSEFFVTIVVGISNALISDSIRAGTVAGQIIIDGPGGVSSVGIGWGCAGLEELLLISVILFVLIHSFGLAYKPLLFWLIVGIVGSFMVNIIRMVILVWVAYDYGLDEMLWLHTHLGDALFLVWVGVFWIVFFKIGRPGDRDRHNGSMSS